MGLQDMVMRGAAVAMREAPCSACMPWQQKLHHGRKHCLGIQSLPPSCSLLGLRSTARCGTASTMGRLWP